MAADKIVKSFLILVSVGCIVRYGSCAPIEEKIVLDNGTVLTMVINEVQKAPPPVYDSALDANRKDEDEQVIVIHEAQNAPPPRIMSKRSADHKEEDGQQLDVKIGDPQHPPAPRSDSETEETSTPSAVDGGVQTTKGVPEQDSDENKDNGKSEPKKVSESPKSETQRNGDDQPGGDAEDEADPEDGDGKGLERTTANAIPTKSTVVVDGSDNSGSKGGSNAERGTNVDAADEEVPDGNGVDDQSAKNHDDENSDNTSTGESPNQKPSTKDSDNVSKPSENIDNKPSGDEDNSETKKVSESPKSEVQGNGDDQPGGENIVKPSVSTPSDDSNDPEETGYEDEDQEFDGKSSLNANDDSKMKNEEEKGDYDAEEEDDINSDRNAEVNPTFNDNEEEGEDDEEKGEISESEGSDSSKKNISEPESSGHFMSYFLIAVVFVACFYLVFHNRQKIKAYVLEGKTGRGRRRKAGNSEYRQLSTAEEVLPAADKGLESKTTYTY